MLLIGYNKSQIIITYGPLDQRMCSDDDFRQTALDTVICPPFFFCCHRSRQKFYLDWNIILFEHLRNILIMLSCKHFCRCHHCSLTAIECRIHQCKHCNDRLTGAHISLHQP